eukprot:365145-Chlamydomonas_euryale.AAC.22
MHNACAPATMLPPAAPAPARTSARALLHREATDAPASARSLQDRGAVRPAKRPHTCMCGWRAARDADRGVDAGARCIARRASGAGSGTSADAQRVGEVDGGGARHGGELKLALSDLAPLWR